MIVGDSMGHCKCVIYLQVVEQADCIADAIISIVNEWDKLMIAYCTISSHFRLSNSYQLQSTRTHWNQSLNSLLILNSI